MKEYAITITEQERKDIMYALYEMRARFAYFNQEKDYDTYFDLYNRFEALSPEEEDFTKYIGLEYYKDGKAEYKIKY